MATNDLTAEYVRSILDFSTDPPTWRVIPHWHFKVGDPAGTLTKDGYRRVLIARRSYAVHRLAWLAHCGEWPRNQLDHINGNRSDNRICNLRDVVASVNMQNQLRAAGCSRKGGKWQAQIQIAGRSHYLGLYATRDAAHAAYIQAKEVLHIGFTGSDHY